MIELSLEEIQQGSFEVLLKFKEICVKNNLNYFLTYGTLIGAIRHKGFIPWDDDIDICMPRPDYEKFIQYCINHAEELEPFNLKHYKTCKEYIYPIARLVDTRYKIEYSNTKDYGLGLFIDIYPLDGENKHDIKHSNKLNRLIRKIILLDSTKYINSPNKIKNIIKFPYWLVMRNFNLNKKIAKLDKIAQKYSYNDNDIVGCAVWELKEFLEKTNFDSNVEVEFNGALFNAPIGYDNLLTQIYGDYMQLPPENERIAHHFYRAYKK